MSAIPRFCRRRVRMTYQNCRRCYWGAPKMVIITPPCRKGWQQIRKGGASSYSPQINPEMLGRGIRDHRAGRLVKAKRRRLVKAYRKRRQLDNRLHLPAYCSALCHVFSPRRQRHACHHYNHHHSVHKHLWKIQRRPLDHHDRCSSENPRENGKCHHYRQCKNASPPRQRRLVNFLT